MNLRSDKGTLTMLVKTTYRRTVNYRNWKSIPTFDSTIKKVMVQIGGSSDILGEPGREVELLNACYG
jgi:hypothetical protein